MGGAYVKVESASSPQHDRFQIAWEVSDNEVESVLLGKLLSAVTMSHPCHSEIGGLIGERVFHPHFSWDPCKPQQPGSSKGGKRNQEMLFFALRGEFSFNEPDSLIPKSRMPLKNHTQQREWGASRLISDQ